MVKYLSFHNSSFCLKILFKNNVVGLFFSPNFCDMSSRNGYQPQEELAKVDKSKNLAIFLGTTPIV
jgi:hypothetical protein